MNSLKFLEAVITLVICVSVPVIIEVRARPRPDPGMTPDGAGDFAKTFVDMLREAKQAYESSREQQFSSGRSGNYNQGQQPPPGPYFQGQGPAYHPQDPPYQTHGLQPQVYSQAPPYTKVQGKSGTSGFSTDSFDESSVTSSEHSTETETTVTSIETEEVIPPKDKPDGSLQVTVSVQGRAGNATDTDKQSSPAGIPGGPGDMNKRPMQHPPPSSAAFREFLLRLLDKMDSGKDLSAVANELSTEFQGSSGEKKLKQKSSDPTLVKNPTGPPTDSTTSGNKMELMPKAAPIDGVPVGTNKTKETSGKSPQAGVTPTALISQTTLVPQNRTASESKFQDKSTPANKTSIANEPKPDKNSPKTGEASKLTPKSVDVSSQVPQTNPPTQQNKTTEVTPKTSEDNKKLTGSQQTSLPVNGTSGTIPPKPQLPVAETSGKTNNKTGEITPKSALPVEDTSTSSAKTSSTTIKTTDTKPESSKNKTVGLDNNKERVQKKTDESMVTVTSTTLGAPTNSSLVATGGNVTKTTVGGEPHAAASIFRGHYYRGHDLGSVLGLPGHLSGDRRFYPMALPMRSERTPGASQVPGVEYGDGEEVQGAEERYAAQLSTQQAKRYSDQPGVCGGKYENCVTDVKVACDGNVISVLLEFAHPFEGFVRLGNPFSDCVVYWPAKDPQRTVIVTIASETCVSAGTRDHGGDGTYGDKRRVYVQFDPETLTHEDVNFLAECAPGENYARDLHLQYSVVDPSPRMIRPSQLLEKGKTSFDVAILSGFSANSPTLSGDVRIGSPLAVLLKVKAANAKFLDLKILSCWAAQGNPSIKYGGSSKNPYRYGGSHNHLMEVVKNGCSTRPTVFGNFARLSTDDPTSMVYYAPFRAFRFAESDTVNLQCKVVLCYGPCPGESKPCPETLVERSYSLGMRPSYNKDNYGRGSPYTKYGSGSEEIIYEQPSVTYSGGDGGQYRPQRSTASMVPHYSAFADQRPKRGTAVLKANVLRFVEEDDNPITGFMASNSMVIEYSKAVIWAKCAQDLVVVTLTDPSGFTGEITIEQHPSPPPPLPPSSVDDEEHDRVGALSAAASLPPSHLTNRLKREIRSFQGFQERGRPYWEMGRGRGWTAINNQFQIQGRMTDDRVMPRVPQCAVSRETFQNVNEATVIRRADCFDSDSRIEQGMKFFVKINSRTGPAKVGVVDCSEKFFVLE